MKTFPSTLLILMCGLPLSISAQHFVSAPSLSFNNGHAVGDIDGSGQPDIIASYPGTLWYFPDPGTSSNPPPIQLASIQFANPIAARDFDGDGWCDVLVLETSSVVFMLWGTGPGTVTAPMRITRYTPFFSAVFEFEDFNGDGLVDLTFLHNPVSTLPEIIVLMQQPGRTFSRSVLRSGSTMAAAGDFNGDGTADLLVDVGGGAELYLGGPLGLGAIDPNAGVVDRLGLAADFDGDGFADVIDSSPATGNVSIAWGDATSPFVSKTTLARVLVRYRIGDLDGDGRPEIVNDAPSPPEVELVRTDRTVLLPRALPMGPGNLVDLDDDGDADLLSSAGRREENLAHYGAYCGAPVALGRDTPTRGATWHLGVRGAPPGALGGVFLALAPQAATCGTRVDLSNLLGNALLFFADSSGDATVTIPVPARVHVGPYFLQAVVLDVNGGYAVSGFGLSSSAGRAVRVF